MADITQSFPTGSMLGRDEDGELLVAEMDPMGRKLGGLMSAEHDGVSASSHIASSLGINPHTLQVVGPAHAHRQEVHLFIRLPQY